MATSSAKFFIEDETVDGRSLMYKLKSSGPKMEPYGTPDNTGDHPEWQPLMTTLCRLVVRNDE